MKSRQLEIVSVLDEVYAEYLAGLVKLRERIVENLRKRMCDERKEEKEGA